MPKTSGSIAGTSVTDNAPPAVVGSGAQMIRINTAGVNFSAGASQTDFPGSYYDTITENSADITVSTATNRFTVSIEAWYMVNIAVETTSQNTGGAFAIGIKQNGALYQMGFGTRQCFPVWGGTFIIYLHATEYITPCYFNSDVSAWGTKGQTDGSRTYFAISLLNRSMA